MKRPYVRKPVSTKEANVRLEGGDVGVQYDDEVAVPHPVNVARIDAVIGTFNHPAVPGTKVIGVVEVFPDTYISQAYALRVWNGQSIDVPVPERCERVRNALRGQNLPLEGVIVGGVSL